MTRLSLLVLVCVASWLGVALLLDQVGLAELRRIGPGQADSMLLVYLLLQVGLPSVVATWVGGRLTPRVLDASARETIARAWRWAFLPLIICYGVTLAFGCPAVDRLTQRSMLAAGRELASDPTCQPELATYMTVPVLPGVVLAYQEAEACGWGGGGFVLYFWGGTAVHRLATYTVWAV